MSVSGPVLLDVCDLTMRFGGLVAVDQVSFQARAGAITAVIGPNGAGKTTLFNCVTGFYRPTSGRMIVYPSGQVGAAPVEIQGWPAHMIARRAGIARTFQNIRLFAGMTALENLFVAHEARASGAEASLRLGGGGAAARARLEQARFWLARMDLLEVADRLAGELPYGAQRRLEIARAMCLEPRLLCLDEPAAGLNPRESAAMGRILTQIRDDGLAALLLIEHDMSVVMGISDHIIVLDYGRKIAEGNPVAVRADPHVIRAYLGEDDDLGAA